ncbi:hypothetical protein P4S72_28810 [Vibrio sp. PP-XX7]
MAAGVLRVPKQHPCRISGNGTDQREGDDADPEQYWNELNGSQ